MTVADYCVNVRLGCYNAHNTDNWADDTALYNAPRSDGYHSHQCDHSCSWHQTDSATLSHHVTTETKFCISSRESLWFVSKKCLVKQDQNNCICKILASWWILVLSFHKIKTTFVAADACRCQIHFIKFKSTISILWMMQLHDAIFLCNDRTKLQIAQTQIIAVLKLTLIY